MKYDLYQILKRQKEYQEFKQSARKRSSAAMAVLVLMWALLIETTDFSSGAVDNVFMTYSVILAGGTVMMLKVVYRAFFRKPGVILVGEIIADQEYSRTVRENGHLRIQHSHRYLVSDGEKEYWGECIFAYLTGCGLTHQTGERVLFFSEHAGEGYIIHFEHR